MLLEVNIIDYCMTENDKLPIVCVQVIKKTMATHICWGVYDEYCQSLKFSWSDSWTDMIYEWLNNPNNKKKIKSQLTKLKVDSIL